jgi:hypothetical protein
MSLLKASARDRIVFDHVLASIPSGTPETKSPSHVEMLEKASKEGNLDDYFGKNRRQDGFLWPIIM